MVKTARRAALTASLGTAVLAAALAAASTPATAAAAVTYRTISGTATCGAASTECTALFTVGSAGPSRLGTSSPVVVQTGFRPDSGPGLPVSLLTGFSGDVGPNGEQGYRFRVLDQTGAISPVTTHSFYHASVPFSDAAREARSVLAFPDAAGNARVNFATPLATAPVAVIATGRSPYTGSGLPVNLVTSGYTRTGFTVRALDQTGAPINNPGIRVHYWATAQTLTPNTRAGQAVVTPDANGRAFIGWPVFAVGLPPVSVVLTGMSPTSGPGLPVNLLVTTAQSNGAAIRVLDQGGRPVTTPVRIAFYATKLAGSTS